MRGLESCLLPQPRLDGPGIEANQMTHFNRGQAGAAQFADFPHAATEIVSKVFGLPKAVGLGEVSGAVEGGGLWQIMAVYVHSCRWMSIYAKALSVVTNGDNLYGSLCHFMPLRLCGREWRSGINGHNPTSSAI